jgi:hypothetical protein
MEIKLCLILCAFRWFKRYREGCEEHEDEPSSRLLSTAENLEEVAKLCKLVARDHQMPLKLMVNQLHIKTEIIHLILHEDLQKRKIYTKFVPHNHTYKQEEERIITAQASSWQGGHQPPTFST